MDYQVLLPICAAKTFNFIEELPPVHLINRPHDLFRKFVRQHITSFFDVHFNGQFDDARRFRSFVLVYYLITFALCARFGIGAP